MALLQGDEDLGWPHFPKFLKKIPGAGLVSKYGKYAVGGPMGAGALLALKNRKKMGRALSRIKGGR
jgi:hypothetical protein